VYTGNDSRGRILLDHLDDKIADVGAIRARALRDCRAHPAGVAWCEEADADAFLITLKKSDSDYSPTTMYRDFALSPSLFHWESQATTSSTLPTGQRYIHHRERGSHILLFVRQAKTNALGTSPYVFLGPANYVSHEGDRPMAITWRLRQPMPTEVYQASTVAVA
jgi:Domain of unknown function (DUF3427)